MRQLRYAALAVAAILAIGACGDDEEGPTGPQIEDIAGDWEATQFVFQSTEDPQLVLPIIEGLDGSFEASIEVDGSFTATIEIPNPQTGDVIMGDLAGTISLDDDALSVSFDSSSDAPALGFDDFSADYELDGDTFTWSADDVDFDFPNDEVEEQVPASVSVVLERVS